MRKGINECYMDMRAVLPMIRSKILIGRSRELKQHGIKEDNIFFEYQSGMKADRVQLWELLNKLVQGDTLIATEVSRDNEKHQTAL